MRSQYNLFIHRKSNVSQQIYYRQYVDFIKSQLSDTYEIGDAGAIISEMVAEELLIANDFDVKRKA